MGGLSMARLRHQPAPAALVAALSGMLAMTAVLGLAYAGAVADSVQRSVLADAPADHSGVAVSVQAARPPTPDQLRRNLSAETGRSSWGTPIAGAVTSGLLDTSPRDALVPVVARDDVCAHLTVRLGRCSQAAGEVVIGRTVAARARVGVGGTLDVRDAAASGGRPALRRLRVVGIYDRVDPRSPYWFGHPVLAVVPAGGPVDGADAVLVGWPTLRAATWRSVTVQLDVPLAEGAVRVATVPQLRADLRALQRRAAAVGALSSTQLPTVLDAAAAERAQARAPMPLLALQAVLLALVVLAYVAGATTEQRRPEVALARLRGQLPAAAARMLVRDLALVVAAGCAVGAVAGWLLARVAAASWLAPGIAVPWTWPLALAAVLAAVAALVAVTVTAVPTVREPLVSLLRAVPPRSSTVRAGLADGVVVALCLAGLVSLLTGERGAPTALLAPGLLALAGGLALAHLTVPVAAAVGRWQLRRGRLRAGLAAVAVSRRPALRRLVAIETVAVALLVFAAAAQAVAADQRRTAAAARSGAPVVLTADGVLPRALRAAVNGADPSGRYATAVVVSSGAAEPGAAQTGGRTVAVDPDRFARIAWWAGGRDPGAEAPPALTRIEPDRPAPVPLRGARLTLDTTFAVTGFRLGEDELFGVPEDAVVMGLDGPARLVAVVVQADGRRQQVDLGLLRPGAQRLTAVVPCRSGCLLRELAITRGAGDSGAALLDLTVTAARTDVGPVDLRAADRGWSGVLSGRAPVVDARGGLHVRARAAATGVSLHRDDVPAQLPVLTAGAVPAADGASGSSLPAAELVGAPGLAGLDLTYRRVGRLPAVPSALGPGVLVSLPLAGELDGGLGPSAVPQVWLGADDPVRERALVAALARAGVPVVDRHSTEDVAQELGEQGTGLALHLATVVGLVALVLAAAVLAVSVATSGRVRAQDLAGLRTVGVPRSVVVGAAVREQLLVALVGVAAGAVLGAAGAVLTLSRAAVPTGMSEPYLLAGLPAAGAAVLVSALLLVGVCVALGVRTGRVAVPGLLRETVR